jgi:hypothetical protein
MNILSLNDFSLDPVCSQRLLIWAFSTGNTVFAKKSDAVELLQKSRYPFLLFRNIFEKIFLC